MDPRALAQKMGEALKETPEYQAVLAAKTRLEEHEAARLMLKDFKEREEAYRKQLAEGKGSEEAGKELQKLAEIASCNPYIRELFIAEARLADLVLHLQREMMIAAGLAEAVAEGGAAADAQSD